MIKLPGFLIFSPVTVATRSISGIPFWIASEIAFTVLILSTITPTSAGRPPLGTFLSMTRLMRVFSAPCGYLVLATKTSIFPISATFSCINSIASCLLSSMTMMPFSAPVVLRIAFRPKIISSANSRRTLWSAVKYGSHSHPLRRMVSTGFAGFSLTQVGKPAPPIPTIPASFTISMISSGVSSSRALCGCTDSCRVFFPSDSMTTAITSLPLVPCIRGSTATTVPLTLECTGALINPAASPIFCPTFTVSPTSTIGLAGAPRCWDMEITTVFGSGNFFRSICSLNSLCSDG